MASDTVCAIGIVGAGQMGRGIASIAAAAGIDTGLFDAKPGAAIAARDHVRQMLGRRVQKGQMPAAEADAALARLALVERLADLAGCDVVAEAIVEDLGAKQRRRAGLGLSLSAPDFAF